jgi:hypothetical protein
MPRRSGDNPSGDSSADGAAAMTVKPSSAIAKIDVTSFISNSSGNAVIPE